jgi:hypothetical protein
LAIAISSVKLPREKGFPQTIEPGHTDNFQAPKIPPTCEDAGLTGSNASRHITQDGAHGPGASWLFEAIFPSVSPLQNAVNQVQRPDLASPQRFNHRAKPVEVFRVKQNQISRLACPQQCLRTQALQRQTRTKRLDMMPRLCVAPRHVDCLPHHPLS